MGLSFLSKSARLLAWCRWLGPLVLLGLVALPLGMRMLKVAELLLVGLCFVAWWPVVERSRLAKVSVLGMALAVGIAVASPGPRASSLAALRVEHGRCLERWVGTRYVWGGEGALGIDCSGLLRRAMMDAAWRVGWRRCDGGLLRAAVWLWWQDCSAKALGEGFLGWTVEVGRVESLNELPAGLAEPGDLAITAGGVHCLACVESGRWIQADPFAGEVVVTELPGRGAWFTSPVRLMRWRWLAEPVGSP